MAASLNTPWLPFDRMGVTRVAGRTGVYELADAEGNVLFLGMVGSKSRLGMRGELEKKLAAPGEARRFRCEATTRYLERYDELLGAYAEVNGTLPPWNAEQARKRNA